MSRLLVKAGCIINEPGRPQLSPGVMMVENGKITDIGPAESIKREYCHNTDVEVLDFGAMYVLPGLIDCHCHLCFPGDGTDNNSYMDLNDDNLVSIIAARNAQKALSAGVTTLCDLGGRNNITFSLRRGIMSGMIPGPRLVLAGSPLTVTGGHMHYLNCEADGEREMEKRARMLLKGGADVIKMVANGGGTRNTIPWKSVFTLAEIAAAVRVAHSCEKSSTAHVSCGEALGICLDAGIDRIEHCDFWVSRDEYHFESRLADRLAEQGVYVGKTLPAVFRAVQRKADMVAGMTHEELTLYDFERRILENSTATFSRFYERGIKLVASTDAGWGWSPFGDFVTDLEIMNSCGMSCEEALVAATTRAAQALRLQSEIGSLEIGKAADFVVVRENPLENISALRNPALVFRSGINMTALLANSNLC